MEKERRVSQEPVVRMEDHETYTTLWGALIGDFVEPWLKAHGIPYELLSGDMCEIPDGVQQYWEHRGHRSMDHAVCIKSRCNVQDLKALSEWLHDQDDQTPKYL